MIADKIRSLRQRNDWSQTALANKLGITRSSVNAWEMGISVPATSTVVELAGIFHVTTDYLLDVSNSPDVLNLEHLSSQEKALIYGLLDYFAEQKSKRL